MGVFHYKATFIEQSKDNKEVYYSYCPDYIKCEYDCNNNFKINIAGDWKTIITLSSDGFENDERCVLALMYKIKKHFDETKEFPQTVFFTA